MKKSRELKDLNLSDDFLFTKVMADEEICRIIIEKILNINIVKIKLIEEQKTINPALASKGIRLDAYAKDDEGTVYEIEMQRGRENDLPRRMRYYQGVIDLELIEKGESYRRLAESFVIFICTFDYFGQGRHIYTFENRCLENKELSLSDGTRKIILNTKGNQDDVDLEMLEFLRYVERSTEETAYESKGELVKKVHEKVQKIKTSQKLEVEYMTWEQKYIDILDEGREEGRRLGLEEGQRLGLEEGQRLGLEEGQRLGREEGRAEGRKKNEAVERHVKDLEAKLASLKGKDER